MAELAKIDEKVDKLTETLKSLNTNSQETIQRITSLEAKVGQPIAVDSAVIRDRKDPTAEVKSVGGSENSTSSDGQVGLSACIQQEFNVIKDSLQRVRLADDLKVQDTRVGVQRKDHARLGSFQTDMKIIPHCA